MIWDKCEDECQYGMGLTVSACKKNWTNWCLLEKKTDETGGL